MKKEYNAVVSAEVFKANDCLGCGQPIAHPICPSCLARALQAWSREHKHIEKEVSKKLKRFLQSHEHLDEDGANCVVCGKKASVCPYCFTEFLYNLVKEAGAGVKTLSEFLFMFNFDFEHEGYSQELNAMGGY